jgi:hypothetical protein
MAESDSFYIEVKGEVDTVLNELGTTYQVRGQGVYDPDELESMPETSRTVSGLIADQQAVLQIVGESSATWVATRTLILKADAAPQEGEEIQVDGKWYPLSRLIPIRPAEITVVYLLDVSR